MVRRTREKEEERKEKKKEFQVGEASSSSHEHPSGQETTIAMSTAGHTVLIRLTEKGDKSAKTKKTDDESGQEEEIDIEGQEEIDVEEQGKATVGQEGGSANDDDDDESGDEPSVVEFEDPVYELSQTYEMEPEYESMTLEQEAMEVQALTPAEQVKYRELTRLHQHQAEIEKKMTGMSKVIEERTKAQTPGLPVDLVKRNVQVEPAEKQELHQITRERRVRASIKQDKIPRTDRPKTSRGTTCLLKTMLGAWLSSRVSGSSEIQILNN